MKVLIPLMFIAIIFLSGCDSGLQGNVRQIGDAIEHCRDYSQQVLSTDVVISVDRISTRENASFYEVFLNLDTQKKHGYAHCQIDMNGLIVSYEAPGFRENSGAFSLF